MAETKLGKIKFEFVTQALIVLLLFVNVMLISSVVFIQLDDNEKSTTTDKPEKTMEHVRFATFNVSMSSSSGDATYYNSEGNLENVLKNPDTMPDQAKYVIETIQRIRPDVLLLNEFNYDHDEKALKEMVKVLENNTFNGTSGIKYRYYYSAESNTGLNSNVDLDNNGVTQIPEDAYGFGRFYGQYGMALLSKYPIVEDKVRTFQKFLWKDMPNSMMPIDEVDDHNPNNVRTYYTEQARNVFRLSSKSHWDVPVRINDKIVHILASHPTPPTFDDKVDQNGRRNHDEIRLFADYINWKEPSYIYDDTQADVEPYLRKKANLEKDALFVIVGDYNADPFSGDSIDGTAELLVNSEYVNNSVTPIHSGIDPTQGSNIDHDWNKTSRFSTGTGEAARGKLRVDYVLPSKQLEILDAVVYWPNENDPLKYLLNASDHSAVYVTVKV